MSLAAAPLLRVGVIGLNRHGLHFIERCLTDGPFQVVATFDPSNPKRQRGRALPHAPNSQLLEAPALAHASGYWDELLEAPDIDVAWIAHPIALRPAGMPSDLVEQLLNHNKHVVIETPLSLSTSEADRWFALARQRGRHLLVHSPRHTDDDIRRAVSAVSSGELGAVRAIKWISWGYGLPPAGVPSHESHESRVTLIRQMAHALDQLVQLVPHAPRRVIAFGEQTEALAAWIEFTNGTRAEIDIRLDSPAPLRTGWVIHSEHGGYADGRRYTLTPEGEVFDSPAPTLSPASDDLTELARSLRSDKIDDLTSTPARTVVQLLEAISRSLSAKDFATLPE